MKIMSVNAGSSSLKFRIFNMPEEELLCSGVVERIGSKKAESSVKYNGKKYEDILPILNHQEAVEEVIKNLINLKLIKDVKEIEGIGHRIVQGGEIFKDSALINKKVVKDIEKLADLAPLHNKAHAEVIKVFLDKLPKVKQVAVFDTTFHQTMPPVTYRYAVGEKWYTKYGVRKYGAHGTSHSFVSEQAIKLLGNPKESKVIVAHLGNGASLCAVKNGKSIDTSMGLTPLEGVPMGTRSGNIDPTVVPFICEKENKTPQEVVSELNNKSGLLGVSTKSNDSRDIIAGLKKGDKRSTLAFNMQNLGIIKYIAQYYVLLGGCDALVFTAGIGENEPIVRKAITDKLGVLGIYIDESKNEKVVRKTEANISDITGANSKTKVLVIRTDEEVKIAREVIRLI